MEGTYEHFIHGPSREALDAVAEDLIKAGYLVPDPPECGGWLLTVYGSLEDRDDDDIRQACAAHGAVYEGGGTYIGGTDELLP